MIQTGKRRASVLSLDNMEHDKRQRVGELLQQGDEDDLDEL